MGEVTPIGTARPKALEFFAGIGLARLGLERAGFSVSWANDFEPTKYAMYENHFGSSPQHAFTLGDIGEINSSELPANSSLAWASSPCTDLSLAGGRAGLNGSASGTFWHYIRILRDLGDQRPPVAVLENVTGLATSHGGDDLTAAIRAFNSLGYSVDVLAIDGRRFVPQSRPRLFLIAVTDPPENSGDVVSPLRPGWLDWVHADPTLITHRFSLPPVPELLNAGLSNLVEDLNDDDERWWEADRVAAFVDSMSEIQRDRIALLQKQDAPTFRTAYRRTRKGVATWEVRPDDISGCLRTARGGSSKQAVVKVDAGIVRVRWMTATEYARLMGAGEYNLSSIRPNQALFGFGDAVAVPVVAWLGSNYLMPLIRSRSNHTGGRAVAV